MTLRHKILIVDDEPNIRKVLVRLLSKEGYSPVESPDGPSALKNIRMEPPETVLLDLSLLYRLNDYAITIQPLRERREDIPYLVNRFIEATNIELGKHVQGCSQEALDTMMTYPWPGNVRQLRSVIRRAVLLAEVAIEPDHLNLENACCPESQAGLETMPESCQQMSLREIVQRNTLEVERMVLSRTLKQTGGNKAKAARLLQIDYKTMHTKIKKLGIAVLGGST